LSASIPLSDGAYRMVPIAFCHAPNPPKPARKAPPEAVQEYRKSARLARLPLLAATQIAALRQALDAEPNGIQRPLHLLVDGGYTNETVLKKLPARTVLIGRIRKDAKLYFLPESSSSVPHRGRPRHYGAPAPTPQQIRSDETRPWSTIDVSLSGAPHQMRVKHLGPVLWRTAGLAQVLQLVVIAPLSYRLRKNSKLLYRRPAFLICTDAHLDLPSLVQGYVQRCDIETNFREEKTLLGVGQAQVRHGRSVEAMPALQVASYALLLLAALRACHGPTPADLLPAPKWHAASPPRRFSTARAINQLRAELWGSALGLTNFSGFLALRTPSTKPEKFLPDLPSAVLYAIN
jgi:Transposase DDE domain